jgi:hypothetical protein
MRYILIQPDIDDKRSKWIAKFLKFDLEINPTKLVKGQGLVKLLDESNYKSLWINFINACSEISRHIYLTKALRMAYH